MDEAIRDQVTTVSDAFFRGIVKPNAFNELAPLWVDKLAPDEQAVTAFGDALAAAGPLTSVQFEPAKPVEGMSSDMQVWVLIDTPSGRFNGGVVMAVEFAGEGLPHLRVRIKSVRVHLPSGDIVLPTEAADVDDPSADNALPTSPSDEAVKPNSNDE
jgi:hypothetical protein